MIIGNIYTDNFGKFYLRSENTITDHHEYMFRGCETLQEMRNKLSLAGFVGTPECWVKE